MPSLDLRVIYKIIKEIMLLGCLAFWGMVSTSCYRSSYSDDDWNIPEGTVSSLDFIQQHHYGLNYNFRVKGDTIYLQEERPMHLMQGTFYNKDSVSVQAGDLLVVADIAIIPEDSVDSVWVKVARDQYTMGWVHERKLLKNVVPDDPISEFIYLFSNKHILYLISAFGVFFMLYLMRRMRRKPFRMIYFNDLPTFYPTGLCLAVSGVAVVYALIQMYSAHLWGEFYFNPSLNPFGQPFVIGIFLIFIWLIVILSLAVLDDVFKLLSVSEALLYLLGLLGVVMLCYLFFSITTLYYLGIPLWFLYLGYSLNRYLYHNFERYICGQCGTRLRSKGTCPHCGAYNE